MKRDNNGSTLITVIVAIAFVTILTSIILGTTVVNMSMKGIDRKVKDDFYYAERGLGDVYTEVGQIVAEVAGDEYEAVFKQIGKTFSTADEAGREFKKNFLTECYGKFDESVVATRITNFDSYIVTKFVSSRIASVNVTSVGEVKYKKKDGTYTDDAITDTNLDEYMSVVIPDVSVTVTDNRNYQSVISTDIIIDCPTVDFLGTNAEVTDYAIIGCQGIYFTSPAGGNNHIEVTGNLYGGVHQTPNTGDGEIYPSPTPVVAPIYGGINVYRSEVKLQSNYVVSKGDINVAGPGSELKIESANTTSGIPAVWFDSMRTVKGATGAKININNANIFALNDLELNANESNVTFRGDYYGYNDKTLATESSLAGAAANKGNSLDYSNDRLDNDSSAILINGNTCTLDLRNLNSLVLLGKAFIDFSSKGAVPFGSPKIAASAESLALQPNQQLYLVPIDFMTTPNPSTYDNLDPTTHKFKLNKTRGELKDDHTGWFGYKYVKQTDEGDDVIADDIFDTYVVKIDGEDVYYAYLKFNKKLWIKSESTGEYEDAELAHPGLTLGSYGSVSSKAAFFDEIMSSTGDTDTELQPSAFRLRGKVLDSIKYGDFFNLQNSVINMNSTAVVYGRNAIVNYDVVNGDYRIKSNTDGLERFASYPENLFKRYQMMCVYLDGKEDYALRDSISISATEQTKIDNDWKIQPVTSPMDNFVLVSELSGKNTSSGDSMYIDSDSSNAPYGACIVAPSFTLSAGSKLKGAAFINGDVTIESGAEVDGLLMATGTITIKGGSSSKPTRIRSNKGLVQSRVDKELSLIEKGGAYKDNYLISYLAKNGAKMYDITPGSKRDEDRIDPDYNSFMHYENWRKGN